MDKPDAAVGNMKAQTTSDQRRAIWEWLLIRQKPDKPGVLLFGAIMKAAGHLV